MYGIEKELREENLNGFYIKNAGYSANPFRLQNALHSAQKLLFIRWEVR